MKNEDVDGVENFIGDDYVGGPDGNNESISCPLFFFYLNVLLNGCGFM